MRQYKRLLAVLATSMAVISPMQAKTLIGITKNDTTLVPLRTISTELGAVVDFDSKKGIITVDYETQKVVLKPDETKAAVNGESKTLTVAPTMVNGTTYVPLRFLGEALGGSMTFDQGVITFTLGEMKKEWSLEVMQIPHSTLVPFKQQTHKVSGKTVQTVTINLKDPRVKVDIAIGKGKINVAQSLKDMTVASKGYASINGTYFAAYNGDVPLPDGTIVKNGKPLHITDIGSTIGFTPNGKVLIDFVTTRVQGYINDEPMFNCYRINRPTPDTSATVLYTSEYQGTIPLAEGWTAVVCEGGKVTKKTTTASTVPANGFVLSMTSGRSERYNVGDKVSYEVTYSPKNTAAEDWKNVTYALSAGPSLIINGKVTGNPKDEKFTESKILTQSGQRSFIGVTKDGQVMIGTTSGTVSEMKNIATQLGLESAMCLDGGASSGMYYNGQNLTTPGRLLNNSIQFKFEK